SDTTDSTLQRPPRPDDKQLGDHFRIHRGGIRSERVHRSEPSSAFEHEVQAGADRGHEAEREWVAGPPVQFRHVVEVHAIDDADQGWREERQTRHWWPAGRSCRTRRTGRVVQCAPAWMAVIAIGLTMSLTVAP